MCLWLCTLTTSGSLNVSGLYGCCTERRPSQYHESPRVPDASTRTCYHLYQRRANTEERPNDLQSRLELLQSQLNRSEHTHICFIITSCSFLHVFLSAFFSLWFPCCSCCFFFCSCFLFLSCYSFPLSFSRPVDWRHGWRPTSTWSCSCFSDRWPKCHLITALCLRPQRSITPHLLLTCMGLRFFMLQHLLLLLYTPESQYTPPPAT